MMNNDSKVIQELQKEIGEKTFRYYFNNVGNVNKLNLDDLGLEIIPEAIKGFHSLEYLSICLNNLTEVPDFLGEFSNLKELYLTNNNLTYITERIGSLTALIRLDLDINKISKLPDRIGNLINLTYLDISSNDLTYLPESLGGLKSLQELLFDSNQLKSLPESLSDLDNLNTISGSSNKITSLPRHWKSLKKLKRLYLDSNNLRALPKNLGDINDECELFLADNPIETPPPEITFSKNNVKNIRNYFQELALQGEGSFSEAKLIIVGEPDAGKTTLAKKLLDPKYPINKNEKMTEGIEIFNWKFTYSSDREFQCNIWDFGGQEIMHSTHRYFLTKRSLYIVLADNRKENTNFYYWLNNVKLLSAGSPVIIVLNEKENFRKPISERLLKSFKNVVKVFNVNLADNTGLADLTLAIKNHLCELPHIGDPVPQKWVSIRNTLNEAKESGKHYISFKEFRNLCKKEQIHDLKQTEHISSFLHDLGQLLHFQNDHLLKNTMILNISWATEAVYQILLDSQILQNRGEFGFEDVARIFTQGYYKDKYAELIQLMLNFDLCYEMQKRGRFIYPQLLLEEMPAEDLQKFENKFDTKEIIVFEYHYDFMPKGLISRLIVRLNLHIYKNLRWKWGMILKPVFEEGEDRKTNLAEIVEYHNERKIRIRIIGKERRDVLSIIRKEIAEIHDPFIKLSFKEMVPCNCPECKGNENHHLFDYNELRQYYSEKEKFIKCRVGFIKDVSVNSLINDITSSDLDIKKDQHHNIHVEFNPVVNVKGAKAKAVSSSQPTANNFLTINKLDVLNLQEKFSVFKTIVSEEISDVNLRIELEKIEEALDQITPVSSVESIANPLNKIKRFFSTNVNFTFLQLITKFPELTRSLKETIISYDKLANSLEFPKYLKVFTTIEKKLQNTSNDKSS